MTNEQEKARELAGLLNAFADGKQLQVKSGRVWYDYSLNAMDIFIKNFYDTMYEFRIKPETKRIALTQQDLIDRELSNKTISLIYGGIVYHISKYDQDGIYYAGGNMFSYEYIKENNYEFLDNSTCYKEANNE